MVHNRLRAAGRYVKRLLPSLVIIFYSVSARAQLGETERLKKQLETENTDTVAWLHKGFLNISVNEGFLHNWAAGGELGSTTVNGLFNGNVTRLYHNQVWSNTLDLAYSLYYAYSNNFVPRKIDDRIDFTSKYGIRTSASRDFFLTGLLNFKSQFTKGYDYTAERWDTFSTSRFLSPAYITAAVGVEFRKGTDRSIFLSPFANRLILAGRYYTSRLPEGAFGIPNGRTNAMQLGAYLSARYQVALGKNAMFKTRLDLYANYLAKDKKDDTGRIVSRDSPGNIDVMSDNLFSFRISRFISVTLGATLIYDNDIPYVSTYTDAQGATRPKREPGKGLGWWQVKQLFALGFEYRF